MLSLFGLVMAILTVEAATPQLLPWQKYPYVIDSTQASQLTLPTAEALHPSDQSESWYFTATVKGLKTGKNYRLVNIFDKNDITAVILNFYQASIFDLSNGDYSTYTDYDVPVVDLLSQKFSASSSELDLTFKSKYGNATWNHLKENGTSVPFIWQTHLPGIDKKNRPFSIDVVIDPIKYPTPFGADTLHGLFEFFAQKNTYEYFQTGLNVTGNITFNGVTEAVVGSSGHFDRQYAPLYFGIASPTGRQYSHEWYTINFDDGTDLSIWFQYQRLNNNTIVPDSGITTYEPNTRKRNAYVTDVSNEHLEYVKFPSDVYHTFVPPPSANMWLATTQYVTCESLGMNLSIKYVQPVPAIELPVEYLEGPTVVTGTFRGKQVKGVGVLETTLALYHDWELAIALYNTVKHLPLSSFNAQGPNSAQMSDIVYGINRFVSSNLLKDDRVAAAAYAENKIKPAIATIANVNDKQHVQLLFDDLVSSFALIG